MTTLSTQVWLTPQVLAFRVNQMRADRHAHDAIQLLCPSPEALSRLNREDVSRPTLIGSGIEHEVFMTEGWVLLIEPQSNLGERLTARLSGREMALLTESEWVEPKTAMEAVASLWQWVGTPEADPLAQRPVSDARIATVLNDLEADFHQHPQPDQHWSARSVANRSDLSESRFLHLFRMEVGVAWRPYLRWKRLQCALNALVAGHSATDAAHLAGFSDSAHLSKTFRGTFGLSIREAKQLFAAGLYK